MCPSCRIMYIIKLFQGFSSLSNLLQIVFTCDGMLMLSYVLKVKSPEINYLTFSIFAKKTKIIDLVWPGLVWFKTFRIWFKKQNSVLFGPVQTDYQDPKRKNIIWVYELSNLTPALVRNFIINKLNNKFSTVMTSPGTAFQECTGSCHENVPAPNAVSSDALITFFYLKHSFLLLFS